MVSSPGARHRAVTAEARVLNRRPEVCHPGLIGWGSGRLTLVGLEPEAPSTRARPWGSAPPKPQLVAPQTEALDLRAAMGLRRPSSSEHPGSAGVLLDRARD
jgi:hypothetical protein